MDNFNMYKVCSFTGHRPEKLNIAPQEVKRRLRSEIQRAISDGFNCFISGMARGVDMWAAEIVLEEKEKNKNIRLFCAVPYEGFERPWAESEKQRYERIIFNADGVKYICKNYSISCFQIRNCYMVNHCERLIAVYNGAAGGTKNTLYYASKKGVEIINILAK